MEYVHGGTLEDIIFSETEIAFDCWDNRIDVALQVAKGMEFLHCREKPIVHRDLKPKNICVSTSNKGSYHCKVRLKITLSTIRLFFQSLFEYR